MKKYQISIVGFQCVAMNIKGLLGKKWCLKSKGGWRTIPSGVKYLGRGQVGSTYYG